MAHFDDLEALFFSRQGNNAAQYLFKLNSEPEQSQCGFMALEA
jgi:hypothetical protein